MWGKGAGGLGWEDGGGRENLNTLALRGQHPTVSWGSVSAQRLRPRESVHQLGLLPGVGSAPGSTPGLSAFPRKGSRFLAHTPHQGKDQRREASKDKESPGTGPENDH